MPSTMNVGFSWVVGRIVSTQPPWSTETSTITVPGRIALRSSRRISLGAAAPWISTAPMTRSALAICRSRLWRLGGIRCTLAGGVGRGGGPRHGVAEHPAPRAEAGAVLGGFPPAHAAAEDHHLAGRDAGHA